MAASYAYYFSGTIMPPRASASYTYGAYLLYNVGFGGQANILNYAWNIATTLLYTTAKQYELYSGSGSFLTITYSDPCSKGLGMD
ncbi:hypothetical protein N7486_003328 [Penicillium sp. IBT 16267x]|nr:hypothetical protein N7486_003328 [Penicillium sp. IBT 16267x]